MKDISYFIPNTVVVGKQSDTPAFVTCRFKYESWLSPSVFERLTGFKPTNQRDREAQLRKAVTDAVTEVENIPTEGFRLVSWRQNPYGFVGSKYKYIDYAVLADPRGFSFALPGRTFVSMLIGSGGNMSDCVLKGKFVYAWNQAKSLTLISENNPNYIKWKTASDAMSDKKNMPSVPAVSKRELVPGKVYRAAKILSGDWMYVGVFDTYSPACHQWAYDHGGKYDIDKFISDESGMLREKWRTVWPTAKRKMIFYSMTPQMQQYVMRSDITGVFSHEVDYPDCTMYNSSLPATFENVLDDVSRNPGFQKIVFGEKQNFVRMPFDVFNFWFSSRYETFNKGLYFPFYNKIWRSIVTTEQGHVIKLIPYTHSQKWTIYDITKMAADPLCRSSLCKTQMIGPCIQVYDAVRPMCESMLFENGKAVDPAFSASFCPKDAADLANSEALYN